MENIGCFGTQITQIHFVSAESARAAWEIDGVWHADYAEYADSFCICGICEICVGNIVVFWHADYAKYADCSCICEICVGYIGRFGTQITQNTQIVLVSAESARAAGK